MTREAFAEMIGWPYIIWTFGIINVVAMLPQLVRIVRTKSVEGLSIGMFWTYFAIQVAYCLHGFLHRDTMLMVSLGLSACVSLTIVVVVTVIRRTKRKEE